MKTLSEIIEWLQTPDKLPVVLVEIPDVILPDLPLYIYLVLLIVQDLQIY